VLGRYKTFSKRHVNFTTFQSQYPLLSCSPSMLPPPSRSTTSICGHRWRSSADIDSPNAKVDHSNGLALFPVSCLNTARGGVVKFVIEPAKSHSCTMSWLWDKDLGPSTTVGLRESHSSDGFEMLVVLTSGAFGVLGTLPAVILSIERLPADILTSELRAWKRKRPKRGRSVATDTTPMPMPGSTVDHIANLLVATKKSPVGTVMLET
jgi:hypothetical protein